MSSQRPYANPELESIAQDVQSGRYATVEQKLFDYLRRNLPAVEQERIVWERLTKKPISPTFAAKQLLLKRKTVDARAEIALQYDEILKEAWYRGDPDHNRVASEWARKHAGGWRDHYALTLALILDAKEEAFLTLYANRAAPKA